MGIGAYALKVGDSENVASEESEGWHLPTKQDMVNIAESVPEVVESAVIPEESVPEPVKIVYNYSIRVSDKKLVALLQEHRIRLNAEMKATEELLKLYTE
jgi:hypothetical protein